MNTIEDVIESIVKETLTWPQENPTASWYRDRVRPFVQEAFRLGVDSTKEDIPRRCFVKEDIEQKVKDIIVEQLGIDPNEVKLEASFAHDLGADSLDTVELVMALEEAFDMEIPDDDAEKILTVEQAVAYIKEHAR